MKRFITLLFFVFCATTVWSQLSVKDYERADSVSKFSDLMLIVGELDDNVDPASTMQVADALIKADKEFELVVLPGVNHTPGGKYGECKRRDFFVKTLLNLEPPNWNNGYK